MKKFIKTYQGANIYELSEINDGGSKPMGRRIIAKAFIPGRGNLSVDFIKEAGSREKAVHLLEQDIDRYLEKHEIDGFIKKPVKQHNDNV